LRDHAGRIAEGNRCRSAVSASNRPRRGQHVTFAVVAIADHQAPSVLVDLTGMGVDVGGHLGLQRRREHLPSTVVDDLIEQRPTGTVVLLVGAFLVVN
jgi:hypothetical protein